MLEDKKLTEMAAYAAMFTKILVPMSSVKDPG